MLGLRCRPLPQCRIPQSCQPLALPIGQAHITVVSVVPRCPSSFPIPIPPPTTNKTPTLPVCGNGVEVEGDPCLCFVAPPVASRPLLTCFYNHAASEDTLKSMATSKVTSPKTDKSRPYVCAICQRSFARLEHLKRHGRSHTKEKPFECPECGRCFARRDLLLRHRRKLHRTSNPSSRAQIRLECATSIAAGQSRARKNSLAGSTAGANSAAASMRSRANIITQVDSAAMQIVASGSASVLGGIAAQSCSLDLADIPFYSDQVFDDMLAAQNRVGMQHGLPNLDGQWTVPPLPDFGRRLDFEGAFFTPASTINPSSLQYDDCPQSMVMDQWPFGIMTNDVAQGKPPVGSLAESAISEEWHAVCQASVEGRQR